MNPALQLGATGCRRAWRDRPYREPLELRGGQRVTLRPALRSDAQAMQQLFSGLSGRSRRRRFHGAVKQLPEAWLLALTTQVPHQQLALVAQADTHDALPRLVAEARYVVDREHRGRAEFALAVADDWQGLGLGRALLQRLAAHAAAEGLTVLVGLVLADNEPMLALMRQLGATLHEHGGDVHAMLAL